MRRIGIDETQGAPAVDIIGRQFDRAPEQPGGLDLRIAVALKHHCPAPPHQSFDSVHASAARSRSVKNDASRHATSVSRRLSVSPPLRASFASITAQNAPPLIRPETRPLGKE